MKNPTKKMILLSSALVISSVAISSNHEIVASSVNLQELVYEIDNSRFVVSYSDYVDALINESGNLYNLVNRADVKLVGLAVNDEYVDYSKFISELINDTAGKQSVDILSDIHTNESFQFNETTIASFEEIIGFDDNGEPQFNEVVIPEVISID